MENAPELKKPSNNTMVYDEKIKNNELSDKEERSKNKKTLFYSVLGTSGVLMIISVCCIVYKLTTDAGFISTQDVAVLAMMMTAPIILSLALMRYIYDGKKSDEPQPTLMLNVGKELASVLASIFKK